jgi:RNA polymerase sigma-70 factor (ECF subfamily)
MSEESELERAIKEYQNGINRDRNGELIVQRLGPILLRYIRKKYSGKDDEDLTQETLLRVFKRIEAFRFEGNFEGWMFKIARNLKNDAFRRQNTGMRHGQSVSLEYNVSDENDSVTIGNSLADPRANPEQQMLNNESLAIRTEALKTLSPREFQVLQLISRDRSAAQIAEILRISKNTVRVTLRNARKKIRKFVNKQKQ